MHQVTGEFPDYGRYDNKSNFYLNADQAFIYFTWSPPIMWEGFIANKPVNFVQIHSKGSSKSDFDWTGFPEEFHNAIPYIVEAIDKAMKVMD